MGFQSRISEYEESLSNGAHAAQEWVEEVVDARPLASLCAVFTAGLMIGASVGCAIAKSGSRQTLSRSRMPQLDDLSHRISEAVSQAIPKNLSGLFGR